MLINIEVTKSRKELFPINETRLKLFFVFWSLASSNCHKTLLWNRFFSVLIKSEMEISLLLKILLLLLLLTMKTLRSKRNQGHKILISTEAHFRDFLVN